MTLRGIILTSGMAVSLMACQTFKASPEEALFAGIAADKIAPAPSASSSDGGTASGLGLDGAALDITSPEYKLAESQIRASTSNPTCAQFNMNALLFAARPETPGFGTGLMKTIFLGTVAGAASGGVASLGIASPFLETAIAGTVNQVVFSGARPVADAVIPSGAVEPSKKAAQLKSASERVGCPYPSWVEGLTPSDASLLLKTLTGEAKAAAKLAKAVQ